MCICEFIVAIVGVTAGNVDPVTQAVNTTAQKVLIAFVCMCGFSSSVILDAYLFFCLRLLIDISLSLLSLGDLLYGYLLERFS